MNGKPQPIEPDPQEVDVSDLLPLPAADAHRATGAAGQGAAPWPCEVPGNDAAEAALDAALDSTPAPDDRLGPVAAWICRLLTDDDVKLMSGRWPGVDGGVLRRATAMRIRVGYASRSAPRAGAPSDAAAVSALLGEIDALTAEVAAAAAGAPEALAPIYQSLRSALVKDAIDFSEAAQRLVPREATAPATAPTPRKPPRAATVRVLSVKAGVDKGGDGRSRLLAAAFVLAVAAAATFHGYRYYLEVTAPQPPRPAGLPAGLDAMVVPGAGATMITPTAEPLDRAELERFREAERAKGNELVELPGGGFLLKPVAAPRGGPR